MSGPYSGLPTGPRYAVQPAGKGSLTRRDIFRMTAGGVALSAMAPLAPVAKAAGRGTSDIFSVEAIPSKPFRPRLLGHHHHAGVDALLHLMAAGGLSLYRTKKPAALASRRGLIAANDIVLLKVNATWKYRGNTNSDLVRGLIQAILEHPDDFTGEVVVFENSQGWGSLACDTAQHYSDSSVQANANKRHHSFTYVVDNLIADPRVSWRQLDEIGETFIGPDDHEVEGYRIYQDVSYPCFLTPGGHRVELKEGIWEGTTHTRRLKLINIPVLKHHDRGGSEITGAVKNVYGILSMKMGDEILAYRHYRGLGRTCGKMLASVRIPVLNILDAIWVSHSELSGYPADATRRINRLVASQDPLALDYWAAKHILYPIDFNPRHHPDFKTVRAWMNDAKRIINRRGGLWDPKSGVRLNQVTMDESQMRLFTYSARQFLRDCRRKSLPSVGA